MLVLIKSLFRSLCTQKLWGGEFLLSKVFIGNPYTFHSVPPLLNFLVSTMGNGLRFLGCMPCLVQGILNDTYACSKAIELMKWGKFSRLGVRDIYVNIHLCSA